MLRVVISGFYGFDNIGDEAILQAIVDEFKCEDKGIDVVVLSADPKKTKSIYNVNAVNRSNFCEVYTAVKSCDALISGGGGLLQDVTSALSIWYYISIMLLAHILGKPVYAFAQGIGPIVNGLNRRMLKYIANRTKSISVRDEKSMNELLDIGVKKPIECTADPALMLNSAPKERGMEILLRESGRKQIDKPVIGFCLRKWKSNTDAVGVFSAVADRVIEELGADVAFIPFHHRKDLKMAEEIVKRMRNDAIMISNIYLPSEILSLLSLMELNVCVRLHGLIFSAKTGVPMVAISYDPKIDSFMHVMDTEPVSDYADMDAERLYDGIKQAWEKRVKLGPKVRKKAEELEIKAKQGIKKVLEDIKAIGKEP